MRRSRVQHVAYRVAVAIGVLLGTTIVTADVSPTRAAGTEWSDAVTLETPPSYDNVQGRGRNGYWDDLTALECVSDGNCTLGGVYNVDQVGNFGTLATQADGTWSQHAIPATWDAAVLVSSLSCLPSGECALGGSTAYQPKVAAKVNGVWSNAEWLPGFSCTANPEWPRGCTWGTTLVAPVGAGVDPDPNNVAAGGGVSAVDCPVSGRCVLGGTFMLLNPVFDAAYQGALVATQSAGVWSAPIEIPGLRALSDGVSEERVTGLSCPSDGNCVVVGDYQSAVPGEGTRAFVAHLTNGVWGNAAPLPGLTQATTSSATSLSCSSVGNCVATGYVRISHSETAAFVATQTNGTWAPAETLVGTTTTYPFAGDIVRTLVACPADGECAIGGYVRTASGDTRALVATSSGGVWSSASAVPGLSSLGNNTDSRVESISCPAAGECVAVGYFRAGAPGRSYQPYAVVQSGGVWGNASTVPGVDPLVEASESYAVARVSCGAVGKCTMAGTTVRLAGPTQRLFAASLVEPPPPPGASVIQVPPAPLTMTPVATARPTTPTTSVPVATSTTTVPPDTTGTTMPAALIAGALAPGEGTARVGSATAEVVQSTTPEGEVSFSVGDVSVALSAVTLLAGEEIMVRGEGARPGSKAGYQVFSMSGVSGNLDVAGDGARPASEARFQAFTASVVSGEFAVGGDGRFAGVVSLPSDTPTGNHALQMVLTGADGTEAVLEVGLFVAGTQHLPATGRGARSEPMVGGALLLALGVVLLGVRRRTT